MTKEDIELEKAHLQQKIDGIASTRIWMKKVSEKMDKYNFDQMYPLIVSLLRKSNDELWNQIDIATSESREYDYPIDNIDKITLNLKIELENALKEGDLDKSNFFEDELKYIEENYDYTQKTLRKIVPLNYKYTDFELFSFFDGIVEKLFELIKKMPNNNKSMDDEQLFQLYFANLFAHKINACGVAIENGQIKISQNKNTYESKKI
jgi:hypothetical protein